MRPLLHATAALAAGTLTLAAQAARAEPLTVAARQAADRPYELAVRVGGYGFRREGDPRPGEGWTECRMNGIGVFGTRALSGPLFVEAGLDFYATADIPLPAAEGGFAAPRATSIGSTGAPGRRNAPGFVNIGYRASLTWADHTVTPARAPGSRADVRGCARRARPRPTRACSSRSARHRAGVRGAVRGRVSRRRRRRSRHPTSRAPSRASSARSSPARAGSIGSSPANPAR